MAWKMCRCLIERNYIDKSVFSWNRYISIILARCCNTHMHKIYYYFLSFAGTPGTEVKLWWHIMYIVFAQFLLLFTPAKQIKIADRMCRQHISTKLIQHVAALFLITTFKYVSCERQRPDQISVLMAFKQHTKNQTVFCFFILLFLIK